MCNCSRRNVAGMFVFHFYVYEDWSAAISLSPWTVYVHLILFEVDIARIESVVVGLKVEV